MSGKHTCQQLPRHCCICAAVCQLATPKLQDVWNSCCMPLLLLVAPTVTAAYAAASAAAAAYWVFQLQVTGVL